MAGDEDGGERCGMMKQGGTGEARKEESKKEIHLMREEGRKGGEEERERKRKQGKSCELREVWMKSWKRERL